MPFGKIALTLLMLSPLIYSVDNDPFRTYEVMIVAAVSSALVFMDGLRGLRKWDVVPIVLFCTIVIVQQLVISNGSVSFGAQYALVMMCMFIPAWAMQAARFRLKNFVGAAALASNGLFVVAVASIYISFFFEIGEVYDGYGSMRAFAWLGDSFTPVIVFLVILFALQGRWLRVTALLGALFMTGGKAAILMLAAAPVIHALVFPLPLTRKIGLVSSVALAALLVYSCRDAILSDDISGFDVSYNTRLLSVEIGIQHFRDNPWFGLGINQSMKTIEHEADIGASAVGVMAHPVYQIHNAFIRTAAETGIGGLSAFLGVCGVLLAKSARMAARAHHWRRSRKRSLVIAGSLWIMSFILVYQSTGWFEVGHPQLAWLLMIATIAAVTYSRAIRERPMGSRSVENPGAPTSAVAKRLGLKPGAAAIVGDAR